MPIPRSWVFTRNLAALAGRGSRLPLRPLTGLDSHVRVLTSPKESTSLRYGVVPCRSSLQILSFSDSQPSGLLDSTSNVGQQIHVVCHPTFELNVLFFPGLNALSAT